MSTETHSSLNENETNNISILKEKILRPRRDSYSDEVVREKMKKYWQVYEPTLESMMLSLDARHLSENEQNEILSNLPPYKGLKILELGAGIGRFTKLLAKTCGHVTAVDFMESYTQENKRVNGHYDNVKFICADVTKLDFPKESFDLVYSNWLLMYLNDLEIESLMENVLKWLTPKGHFFFRESCYHQSGNVKRFENPTEYRTPLEYMEMLRGTSYQNYQHDLISVKSILTYIVYHGNPNQLCLLTRKTEIENNNVDVQPSSESIFNIEDINFHTDIEEQTKKIICDASIQKGERVLNIDCHRGDYSISISSQSGAFVHGVDSNPVNIHKAIEKQGKVEKHIKSKVQFEFCHLSAANFSENNYNTVLQIGNKVNIHDKDYIKSVIRIAKTCLKDGGKLVISCYVSKSNIKFEGQYPPTCEEIVKYLMKEDLLIVNKTQENVLAWTDCQKHLSTLENSENSSTEVTKYISKLISALKEGDMRWMTFIAQKEQQHE